jgi:hypothetical protein
MVEFSLCILVKNYVIETSWCGGIAQLFLTALDGGVGTSHIVPGVRSRTGYLATEQSNTTVQDWLPGYRTAQTQQ